jgi:hypothetical protein
MLRAQATDSKNHMRLSADRCGIFRRPATISCKIVQWRATADEDGHYCFAVPL